MKVQNLLLTFSLLTTAALTIVTSSSAFALPTKVILVVFENTTYDEALSQPFFAEFARKGALLTNYFGIRHPSQPNYVAMIAGSTMGISNDKNVDLSGQHLGDLLEGTGHTWRVYAEGLPSTCFLGAKSGKYARKHIPFISFTNVQSNTSRCANIVGADHFVSDIQHQSLADFSMYVPDLNNDGHDTGSAFADAWFQRTFGPLLNSQAVLQNTLIIATFDEDDGGANNRVYFAAVGAGIAPGTQVSAHYDHYSMLRTVEDLFQIGNLGREDVKASPIHELFIK